MGYLGGGSGGLGSGVMLTDRVADYASLPNDLDSNNEGEAYLVDADGKVYVWDGAFFPADGDGVPIQGPAGPTGATGPQGDPGEAGAAGANGTDGATILSGAGAPDNGEGNVGDYYINETNLDFYEKTGEAEWTVIANLTGIEGSSWGDLTEKTTLVSADRFLVANSADSLAGVYATYDTVLKGVPGRIRFRLNGGGAAVGTGVQDVFESVGYAGTITGWTVVCDQSATVEIEIIKDTYANFPPTNADTIVASAPLTTTAAVKNASTTLTGWTTSFAAGDIFGINVVANDNAEIIDIFIDTERA